MPFVPRFSTADAQVLERDAVYEGFFSLEKLRLEHRLFGGGWSQPMSREVFHRGDAVAVLPWDPCLLYTSPSPRDQRGSRMPSSA